VATELTVGRGRVRGVRLGCFQVWMALWPGGRRLLARHHYLSTSVGLHRSGIGASRVRLAPLGVIAAQRRARLVPVAIVLRRLGESDQMRFLEFVGRSIAKLHAETPAGLRSVGRADAEWGTPWAAAAVSGDRQALRAAHRDLLAVVTDDVASLLVQACEVALTHLHAMEDCLVHARLGERQLWTDRFGHILVADAWFHAGMGHPCLDLDLARWPSLSSPATRQRSRRLTMYRGYAETKPQFALDLSWVDFFFQLRHLLWMSTEIQRGVPLTSSKLGGRLSDQIAELVETALSLEGEH
jgi:hypothetical protein